MYLVSGRLTKLAQFRRSISIGSCLLRRAELASQLAQNFKLLFVSVQASPSEAGFTLPSSSFAAGWVCLNILESMIGNSFDIGQFSDFINLPI